MERVTTDAGPPPSAGEVLELTVGEAVHGGWCVCRQNDRAWVIFVRHALPGERVRALVTQVTSRFARADAVEVLTASPDRVPVPCRYAGPGGCGGCDWQHASLAAQRKLKAAVVGQQLRRLAGLDLDVTVETVPGDAEGLGWRTDVTFAVAPDGGPGLRRHRSREVIKVSECLIAHPLVAGAGVTGRRWAGAETVEVCAVPESGERGILVRGSARGLASAAGDLVATDSVMADSVVADTGLAAGRGGHRTPVRGRDYLTHRAVGRDWRVRLGGFWQVHPGAADLLCEGVLAALDPEPGETALDLYCGAGLFAGVLAERVGPDGAVIAIEADTAAVRDARHNLRDWPWARVHRGDVARVLERLGLGAAGAGAPRASAAGGSGGSSRRASTASVVVLDPPRTGVARPVIDWLCGPAAPGLRRIAYVSCDPATLARDLRLLLDGGWRLDGLRGFDAFPMTHHVECLAALSRPALSRPARARPARARPARARAG
jgi:tRNA/tmRNA/rRNA uracil-C5-methylase (TrmA/RlmC/RlmD family)